MMLISVRDGYGVPSGIGMSSWSSSSSSSSSDTALGQNMTIMAGFGVAHKLYIYI